MFCPYLKEKLKENSHSIINIVFLSFSNFQYIKLQLRPEYVFSVNIISSFYSNINKVWKVSHTSTSINREYRTPRKFIKGNLSWLHNGKLFIRIRKLMSATKSSIDYCMNYDLSHYKKWVCENFTTWRCRIFYQYFYFFSHGNT